MTGADGRDMPDAGGDDAIPAVLQSALQQLPRERPVPDEAAAQLLAAIDATRAPAAPATVRRVHRAIPMAAAAVLMLMAGGLLWRRSRVTPVVASGVPVVVADTGVRAHAVADERRNWYAAVADTARSARWPRDASAAVDSALATTDRALTAAQDAFRRDSTDSAARDAILLLRERQLELLQRARLLLDEI